MGSGLGLERELAAAGIVSTPRSHSGSRGNGHGQRRRRR
jgi:hypothetical protein